MLTFQVLLLAGYAYAHLLVDRLSPRGQRTVHLTLLFVSLAFVGVLGWRWGSPITPGPAWRPDGAGRPVLEIVRLLAITIGLPFLLLASTGPLVQAWSGRARPGGSPYRLYAVSNVASLLALLAFPFLLEPRLPLRTQGRLWSYGYVLFVLASGCSALLASFPSAETRAPAPVVPRTTRLLWLALAATPSVMLLATTSYISSEIAVIPLLWILPLGLYLLSFILCFEHPRWYRRGAFHIAFGVAIVAVAVGVPGSMTIQIAAHALALFVICMVCHGELARTRPSAERLTSFYLMIALGGALGGTFVGLAAPRLFAGLWEYQLGLWTAAALLFVVLARDRKSWLQRPAPWLARALPVAVAIVPELAARGRDPRPFPARWNLHLLLALGLLVAVLVWRRRGGPGAVRVEARWARLALGGGLMILAAILLGSRSAYVGTSVELSRNFYGMLAVMESTPEPGWTSYALRHGRMTIHGFQFRDPTKRALPTAYYDRGSGVGLALLHHPRRPASLRIGVVGLGVGTLAAYAKPGDSLRFYEINPAIVRIAEDVRYFTYLHDAAAPVDIVPGDARLSLERELERGEPQEFDLLAVDAFSGDAIPVHLLTLEAFRIYLAHLRDPGGVLAVHISNRSLNLLPVVYALADRLGLEAASVWSRADGRVANSSHWVLVARDRALLDVPEVASATCPRATDHASIRVWTDDDSNLFQILEAPPASCAPRAVTEGKAG